MPSPSCSASVLLGLSCCWDLWGCFGANFAPVLSVSVLDEASGFRDHYRESDMVYLLGFHSLVLGRVAVLVAVVKVDTSRDAFGIIGTFLEDVGGTVTSNRDALV